ncbi:hypothetical protein HC358_03450 [Wolbachia pipientis]|uniref:Uncharacterized protein n=1 Tax=Wolbachia pipientis TaxID=955 RepID=A0A7G5CA86_WOLPI|nr:hypothetical protein [Wolbachia pipientis]QMV46120.1 hypothetical protein HC358_03450 [Wolbachia pipientis]
MKAREDNNFSEWIGGSSFEALSALTWSVGRRPRDPDSATGEAQSPF